ncbi:MAG: hypothetical protein FJ340_05275 [Sphingomonadales bacterium]|nr:hypothetical protein [Sphingomonadales bacterium]
MNVFFDQVDTLEAGEVWIRKETWSPPCLLRLESSIIQQEEDALYRALVEMDENDFRFLSGSGR